MTAAEIHQRLKKLAMLRAKMAGYNETRQNRIEAISALSEKQKHEIEKVETFYEKHAGPLEIDIQKLESEVKKEISENVKATVKAAGIMAVYTPPRVSWDAKKLEGMMAIVPQIEAARKVAEFGTVAIRTDS